MHTFEAHIPLFTNDPSYFISLHFKGMRSNVDQVANVETAKIHLLPPPPRECHYTCLDLLEEEQTYETEYADTSDDDLEEFREEMMGD